MMKYAKQNGGRHVWFMLSDQVVAFKKARNLLRRMMRKVLYCRTAMAIEMVSKVDTFCIIVLFAVALVAAEAKQSK